MASVRAVGVEVPEAGAGKFAGPACAMAGATKSGSVAGGTGGCVSGLASFGAGGASTGSGRSAGPAVAMAGAGSDGKRRGAVGRSEVSPVGRACRAGNSNTLTGLSAGPASGITAARLNSGNRKGCNFEAVLVEKQSNIPAGLMRGAVITVPHRGAADTGHARYTGGGFRRDTGGRVASARLPSLIGYVEAKSAGEWG